MSEVRFRAKARPIGNSLSVIIPAAKRKQAGIRPQQEVEVVIRTHPRKRSASFGLLERLRIADPGPFVRKREAFSRDRI